MRHTIAILAAAVLLAAPGAVQAWGKQEITTTITHPDGRVEVIEERVSKSILKAREANEALIEAAEIEREKYEALAAALPPVLTGEQFARIAEADPQTARLLAEWGERSGDKATMVVMATALNPEVTSATEATRQIQINRDDRARRILATIFGTAGGVELTRAAVAAVTGNDYSPGGGSAGAIRISAGHNVRSGSESAGGGAGSADGLGELAAAGAGGAGGAGGGSGASADNSPIAITINQNSVNGQAWDSGIADMETAREAGMVNPGIGEGVQLQPEFSPGGLNLSPQLF